VCACLRVQKIPVPMNGDEAAVSKYALEVEGLKKKARPACMHARPWQCLLAQRRFRMQGSACTPLAVPARTTLSCPSGGGALHANPTAALLAQRCSGGGGLHAMSPAALLPHNREGGGGNRSLSHARPLAGLLAQLSLWRRAAQPDLARSLIWRARAAVAGGPAGGG
jgi:hypothetical protein